MKRILIVFSVLLCSSALFSQNQVSQSGEPRSEALKVYMSTTDFIREEISYINYVRDLNDADVYIIETSRQTGSGGSEFTYFIYGRNDFSDMADTVVFYSSPDDTYDIIRKREVAILQMALMRYVLETPLASNIKIDYDGSYPQALSTDKWDNWVFNIAASGRFAKETDNYTAKGVIGGLNINRITDKNKLIISGNYDFTRQEYKSNTSSMTIEREYKSIQGLLAFSLGEHWSAGGFASAGTQEPQNIKFYYDVTPALEFDLFPYSESTRRQLRFLYRAGYGYKSFVDTTIFGETEISSWKHSLSGEMDIIERWGNMGFYLNFEQFLTGLSEYDLDFEYFSNIRIARGLFLTISAGIDNARMQTAVMSGGNIIEEYRNFTNIRTQFGLSYRFGSIYNNVVNPRFGY